MKCEASKPAVAALWLTAFLLWFTFFYLVHAMYFKGPERIEFVAEGPPVPKGVACSEEELVSWVVSKGAILKRVAFADFLNEGVPWESEEGQYRRGIMTLEPLQQGEPVASIPINISMGPESVNGTELEPLIPLIDTFQLSIVQLLYEALKPDSEWKTYLCLLPRQLPSSIFWTDEQLDAADEGIQTRVFNMRNFLLHNWFTTMPIVTAALPHLFPADKFTRARFLWAGGIVWSRAWGSKNHDHILLPFMDMFNHDNSANPVSFSETPGYATLYASKDSAPGVEVHDSYGYKCSTNMLVFYGFAPPDNDWVPCEDDAEAESGREANITRSEANVTNATSLSS